MINPDQNTPCCASSPKQQSLSCLTTSSDKDNLLFNASFVAASYFIAMLVSFSGLSAILPIAGATASSSVLLAIGGWGINLITLCVVSFLFFSEAETSLRRLFSQLLEALLFSYMIALWWPLSQLVMNSEWSLVFAMCGAITLVWLRYYCGCQAKSVFNAMIFLKSALLSYFGLTLLQSQQTDMIAISLLFSGASLFLAFGLNQVSEETLAKSDRQALQHLLFLLNLLGNYAAIYLALQ